MKILGIDPGYDRLGLAILVDDQGTQTYEYSECFTPPAGAFEDRLLFAGTHFKEMLSRFSPAVVALETLFVTKNQKTAMHVAEMRGVLLYEARRANTAIYEYTPSQVKLSVTGYGKSDKTAIALMLSKLLSLPTQKMLDDEYDAIAVALTHAVNHRR